MTGFVAPLSRCGMAWLIDWFIGWLIDWMSMKECMNAWMTEWMNACMHAWMNEWMLDWLILRVVREVYCNVLQRLSVTQALQRFFSHFENCILVDVNQIYPWQKQRVEFPGPLFQCQFSAYPSCSFIFTWLVDKQKLRSKTYKIVWSAFSLVLLTAGNVLKLQIYKQWTTTTTWDWTYK